MNYGTQVLIGLKANSEQYSLDNPRSPVGLSEIGNCPRKLWYQVQGQEQQEEDNLGKYMLFDIGHKVEASIIEGLRAAGVVVIDKLKTGDQISLQIEGIPGHIDGLILEPLPDTPKLYLESIAAAIIEGYVDFTQPISGVRRLLLECKSMSEYSFKGLVANGLELSNPGYFLQAHAYAVGLQLDGIVFIAVNKGGGAKDNKGNVKQIMYQERMIPNKPMIEAHLSRLLPQLQQEEPVDRPFIKPAFPCSYCPFFQPCWEGTEYAAG